MLANNINDHLEPIKFRRTFKEYLTMKEVQMLKYTPKGMKEIASSYDIWCELDFSSAVWAMVPFQFTVIPIGTVNMQGRIFFQVTEQKVLIINLSTTHRAYRSSILADLINKVPPSHKRRKCRLVDAVFLIRFEQ